MELADVRPEIEDRHIVATVEQVGRHGEFADQAGLMTLFAILVPQGFDEIILSPQQADDFDLIACLELAKTVEFLETGFRQTLFAKEKRVAARRIRLGDHIVQFDRQRGVAAKGR